jgi:CheY-like chemotaxis protein
MSLQQDGASKLSFGAAKALVLDPNPMGRSMLSHALQQIGLRSIEACSSPRIALERLQEFAADFVLMDWSDQHAAPETIRLLRSRHSPNRYVPIIVASAVREAQAVLGARDAGMSEFFLKPFTVETVRSRVVSVLSRPRPFVEANGYFGPDRRRRGASFEGEERRRASGARPGFPLGPAGSAPMGLRPVR